jgi:hypothetical protein
MAGSSKSNSLDIGQWLPAIRQIPEHGTELAQALQRMVDGFNQSAANGAVAASGPLSAPPQIGKLDVSTCPAGFAYMKITDNGHIQRGINYFVEHADNPAFTNAHTVDLQSSRNGQPIYIGNASRYFRAYSHYQGANEASKPVNFGGDVPQVVSGGGSSAPAFQDSAGAGTAPTDGSKPGKGLGPVLYRPPATNTKRIVS